MAGRKKSMGKKTMSKRGKGGKSPAKKKNANRRKRGGGMGYGG